MNKAILPLCVILVSTAPAGAQIAGVPRLGWLPGVENHSARPVFGVPGSARVGKELPLPENVRLLDLHPLAPMALVLQSDSGGVGLMRLATEGEQPVIASLQGAYASPDLAVWSPSGKAVLLAWRESQLAQVWAANGQGLSLLEEFPFNAQYAAVSDDGKFVLSLEGTSLTLHREGGAFVAAESGDTAAFAFFPGSSTFAFTSGDQVVIHDGNAEVRRFANGLDGQAMLVSPAPGRILAVHTKQDGSPSEVRLWSEGGELLAAAQCPARVLHIRGVGQPGLVWLQSTDDVPAWFADMSSSTIRVFFVPPPPEPVNSEGTEGGDR